jgi:uncharacterized protein
MQRRQALCHFASASIAATLGTAGCANSPPPAVSVRDIKLYSAGPGSAFLPYAQGLAAHLSKVGLGDGPLKATALESRGSTENLLRVNDEPAAPGVATLGLAFLGTAHEALEGNAAWTQGRRLTNVRALFPMYETSFQVVALRSSNLASVRQLDGKRVGVGPAGGPAESFFAGLAQVAGIRPVAVNGNPAQLVREVLEGRIDALWNGAIVPIPALMDVARAAPATVFGMTPQEQAGMLQRFPALAASSVAPGTYPGQA